MSYELRSARWIAADVLRQVVQPGDTCLLYTSDAADEL